MDNISRIEILEQRFRDGALTEVEQDELFELLKKEGILDSWLEGGIKLTPTENIIYEDKDFLKSIAEPIETLKADKSVVYKNKSSLYRRDISLFSIRNIRIVAAVAVILFIPIVLQRLSDNHQEEVESSVVSKVEQLNFTPNIKAIQHSVVADHTTINISAEHYLSNIESKVITTRIAKDIAPTVEVAPTVETVAIASVIKDDKVVPIITTTPSAENSETTIKPEVIYEIEIPIIKPQELVLYASAEQWSGESAEYYHEELVVEHEEWQPSQTRRQRMLKRIKEQMNHVL